MLRRDIHQKAARLSGDAIRFASQTGHACLSYGRRQVPAAFAYCLNRRVLVGAALLLGVFTCPAAAQQTVYEETGGRYFRTFWLIMLIVQCSVWIGTFDWVGRDTERLKGRRQFWGMIMMSVGAAGTAMMLFVSVGFVFTTLIAQFAVFGIYVWKRNMGLPPERRVLTLAHLNYVFRTAAERLHLRGTAGAVIQRAGRGEAAPEIVLLHKKGVTLDQLAESRASDQVSEAVLAVKQLIESAVLSRVTDIHLEPKQSELQARFRIDGILHNVPSYPPELALPMVSAIKVLSDMDITVRRKPQDGTFMGRLSEKELDFRVATTPSIHGETMVIRVLDRSGGLMGLDELGLPPQNVEAIRRVVNSPNGMMIASGPTGSGKTTTLYSVLATLDAFQKNIVTIENPIEYRLDNINQTQVNPKAGVTFASALTSFLRQDPDVIMVGEIRDAQTASVALQAAMTGHFVFTTLHANDSITTLFRLLDLGVEPYLIASSLSAVLAQRLLRVLCPVCKIPYVPQPRFLRKIGIEPSEDVELYKAQGCDDCQGTGYKGRIGIFEFLLVNDPIKELIRTNPSVQLIKQEARKAGWRTLQESGLFQVVEGETSIKELVRVTK